VPIDKPPAAGVLPRVAITKRQKRVIGATTPGRSARKNLARQRPSPRQAARANRYLAPRRGPCEALFRSERAIDAARRFISRNVNATLRTSEVVEFLRRRREQLPEADIEHCATEAMERWLSSRANRFRLRPAHRDALGDGA